MELFNGKGEANSKPLTTEKVIEAMDIRGRTHLLSQQRRIKSKLSKEEIAYLSEHRNEYPDMEIVEERIRHCTVPTGPPFNSRSDRDISVNYTACRRDPAGCSNEER
ncbi:hypothetical protein A3848_17795 [Paenibacillus sp. P32E]|nr:hypothetical protein A3848_17795 [Paenibacillus sp. P32E]